MLLYVLECFPLLPKILVSVSENSDGRISENGKLVALPDLRWLRITRCPAPNDGSRSIESGVPERKFKFVLTANARASRTAQMQRTGTWRPHYYWFIRHEHDAHWALSTSVPAKTNTGNRQNHRPPITGAPLVPPPKREYLRGKRYCDIYYQSRQC